MGEEGEKALVRRSGGSGEDRLMWTARMGVSGDLLGFGAESGVEIFVLASGFVENVEGTVVPVAEVESLGFQ